MKKKKKWSPFLSSNNSIKNAFYSFLSTSPTNMLKKKNIHQKIYNEEEEESNDHPILSSTNPSWREENICQQRKEEKKNIEMKFCQ